jgi:hypothetical protein
MSTPNTYRLEVNAQISGPEWASGGISIREQVTIGPLDFKSMAEILNAFHTLCQKYQVQQ